MGLRFDSHKVPFCENGLLFNSAFRLGPETQSFRSGFQYKRFIERILFIKSDSSLLREAHLFEQAEPIVFDRLGLVVFYFGGLV